MASVFDIGIFGDRLHFVMQCYLSVNYIFHKKYNSKKVIAIKYFVVLSVIECFANRFSYRVVVCIGYLDEDDHF